MLGAQGIISQQDSETIINGLEEVLAEVESGKVAFEVGAEDIHMNVEKILTEKIGTVAKRLHTARSRNDQVALDIRIYMKEEITAIRELLAKLEKVILDLARQHVDTIMPGYTHLQKAQPITFAHHLMA